MKILQAIEIINDFKSRRLNWFPMAGVIQEISNTAGWVGHYKSNGEWIKAAAKVSGYEPAVIRRMLRVRQFLERMVEQEHFVMPNGCEVPLASLEILERMYALSPQKVKELLPGAVRGDIKLREVQQEYNHLQAEQSQPVKVTSKIYEEVEVHKAIMNDISLFCGQGFKGYLRRRKWPLLPNTRLVAIHGEIPNPKDCDGFQLLIDPRQNYETKRIRIVHHITYESSFFRRYWVILGEDSKDIAIWLRDSCMTLGLYNVGIVVVKDLSEAAPTRDHWYFPGSVFNPKIHSTEEQGFFPTDEEFRPPRMGMILQEISEEPKSVSCIK